MRVDEAIRGRRSVLSFSEKTVPCEEITELVGLANLAPSAMNAQNRHFIVVTDQTMRKELARAALEQPHISEAPVTLVAIAESKFISPKEMVERCNQWGMNLWNATPSDYSQNMAFTEAYKGWKRLWPIIDAAIATQTLILAAYEKGIDSCWVGQFDEAQVRKLLNVPQETHIVALVALGYQKSPPPPKEKRPVREILHWETW